MKSEKSFWTLAAITYTIAWGWSFFFANAYFWDDWAFFFGVSPEEHAQLWAGEEKHFLNQLVNPFLLEYFAGVWVFRLLIFVFMFGAGVLAYKIILRLNFFPKGQCQLFTLVFLLVPVNHARFSIQTFEYSFSYFFFFLGWFLLLLGKPLLRLCALGAILIAIGTPSLTIFLLLPLANLLYLEQPKSPMKVFIWLIKNADIFFLVGAFAVFFKATQGDVKKYNPSAYGILYSILLGVFLGIASLLYLRHRRQKSLSIRQQVIVCSGLALIWLGMVPYLAVGYNPFNALPSVFRPRVAGKLQAGQYFDLSLSLLKVVAILLLAFLLLYLIKQFVGLENIVIPNFLLILYLLNSYLVGPLDWDSRLQLLWPLGLALVMVGLFESIPSHLYQKNSVAVIISLTLLTSLISAEYYVDSLKQKALIAGIQTEVKGVDNGVYFVREEQNLLNARSRTYREYEWNGIISSALDEDNISSKILSGLDGEQSCPDSKVCLVIYPRVTSSFIGSLIRRRVDIEIGCSDLSIVPNSFDINACPER
jgi:hypothetical protein